MKKIYTILGNKPFEDKLLEQVANHYKPIGSSDTIDNNTISNFRLDTVDLLVVREFLAANFDEFYDFLKQVKEINSNLKVIAILQNKKVADDCIFKVASLGIFDIINVGTRLADVIEMAIRDSKPEDVFELLSEEQRNNLLNLVNVEKLNTIKPIEVKQEELLIEIDGELGIDEDAKATGFKERYLSGITQVYSPSNDEKERIELPDLPPNELVSPIIETQELSEAKEEKIESSLGFHFPGLSQKDERLSLSKTSKDNEESIPLSIDEILKLDSVIESSEDEVKEVIQPIQELNVHEIEDVTIDINEKTIDELPTGTVAPIFYQPSVKVPDAIKEQINVVNLIKYTFFLVSHRLASSIAMQYAVAKAKNKRIAYIETDNRNQVLKDSLEKKGVKFHWFNRGDNLSELLQQIKNDGFNEVIINTSNLMYLRETKPDMVFCEILQDREYAVEIRERMTDYPNARIIVSYFEPDLISQKSLNKVYGRSSTRWVNTRIEEYNSRLNGKLLQNESINEVFREV